MCPDRAFAVTNAQKIDDGLVDAAAQDAAGNVWVALSQAYAFDGGSDGTIMVGGAQVLELDAEGRSLWQTQLPGPPGWYGQLDVEAIAPALDGSGSFWLAMDGTFGIGAEGVEWCGLTGNRIVVARFDRNGACSTFIEVEHQVGGLFATREGGVIIVTETSTARFDAAGNVEWKVEGLGSLAASVNAAEEVLVGGEYWPDAAFLDGGCGPKDYVPFLTKLHADGSVAWSNRFDGRTAGVVTSVMLDDAGRSYALLGAQTFVRWGSVGYAPRGGGYDVVLIATNEEGEPTWLRHLPGPFDQVGGYPGTKVARFTDGTIVVGLSSGDASQSCLKDFMYEFAADGRPERGAALTDGCSPGGTWVSDIFVHGHHITVVGDLYGPDSSFGAQDFRADGSFGAFVARVER